MEKPKTKEQLEEEMDRAQHYYDSLTFDIAEGTYDIDSQSTIDTFVSAVKTLIQARDAYYNY